MTSPTRATGAPRNALTVDVEEYFQVEGFADVVPRESWGGWESRVERSTSLLLELFDRQRARGTFFVLGWVAERQPRLIRAIAAAGHEIGCHGWDHQLVYRQRPEEFRTDVRRARQCLEQLIGEPVVGYRAPCYSITAESTWALDVLVEEGFRYDSSIFPVHHDRYGLPSAPRFPHQLKGRAGTLLELPPSTVAMGPLNLPLAGGGYFRLLPYPLFRAGLRWINRREGQAAVFVIHPWEVDPAQPSIHGTRLNVWRHRVNLRQTLPRLTRLLTDFRFGSVRDVFGAQFPSPGWAIQRSHAEPV